MFLFLFLVLPAAAVAWWAAWRVRHRRMLALASRLPGPPALPVLGNALLFKGPTDIVDVLGKLKQEYGRVFKFWSGLDLNFCISEPDDVKILLQSNKINARGPQYKYLTDILGYGLLSGSGQVWRKRRKLISSNYNNISVDNYCDIFNEETGILLESLRRRPAKQSFDIYEDIVKATSYTVCRTLFGLSRQQTLSLPYLQEVIDKTHQLYLDTFVRMSQWYMQIDPIYWFSQYNSRRKKNLQKVYLMGDAVIKHRIETLDSMGISDINAERQNAGSENNAGISVIDKFILSKSLPDYEDMLKQIFTVFTTSQETTASISSFLLLMLAYHPECQEKLYAEIKSVFGDTDRAVTEEDVKRMPYLDMALKEVLRLFPSGSIMQRSIIEDIDISNGVTLPAGSSLIVPVYHIHRDPEFWPDPDAFDPERFSPERTATRPPGSYIPFSLGPMNCLGRHFGFRLMKTICIRVLREFRLSSPQSYADLELICVVPVESVLGFPVFLHPRCN